MNTQVNAEIVVPRRTVDIIMRETAVYLGVSKTEVFSKLRSRRIVRARQVAFYLSGKLTKMPLSEIGRRCGGVDRSTVFYGIANITAKLETDDDLKKIVDYLATKIESGDQLCS
jgi:chromosomal replication initiator protein